MQAIRGVHGLNGRDFFGLLQVPDTSQGHETRQTLTIRRHLPQPVIAIVYSDGIRKQGRVIG
eukprot:scaffold5873_cov172-Amphora_coffeaeformis.AAC.13